MNKVYVRSGSLISAAGNGYFQHRKLFQAKQSVIARDHGGLLPVARIPMARLDDAIRHRQIAYLRHSDPVTRLGIWAAREATANMDHSETKNCLVLAGSSRGATFSLEQGIRLYHRGEELLHSTSPSSTLGSLSAAIATDIGSTALQCSVSAACTTSLHSIGIATKLLQTDTAPFALCGGSEYASTAFTLAMLKAAGIYCSVESTETEPIYRPFAMQSYGMVLGDGAAFLVLTTTKPAQAIEVKAYAAANELSYGTHISKDGLALQSAVRNALTLANLKPSQIDLIVTHGAGTEKGDLAELSAYRQVFGKNMPKLGTYKWMSGHSLGAAGATSAVLAWHLMQHGDYFPAPYEHVLQEFEHNSSTELQHVLVSSLGFGGNAAVIILSRVSD